MRYPATEKLEIIRQVEQSHLPAKHTLDLLDIPRTTFYRWYDRYLSLGEAGLEDRPSQPSRVWNRIPDKVRDEIVRHELHVALVHDPATKRFVGVISLADLDRAAQIAQLQRTLAQSPGFGPRPEGESRSTGRWRA